MSRLNLSRRPGQTIRIGEHGEIEVTVVRVRGQAVDLVIAADASIPIHRQEIFLAREGLANGKSEDTEKPRPHIAYRRRARQPQP
ncbi:MAG: carbon storage regulator [Gammaproteobacteria bacterium]|nr:carbon storage regulator [Gammaproteobacteria bacterium]